MKHRHLNQDHIVNRAKRESLSRALKNYAHDAVVEGDEALVGSNVANSQVKPDCSHAYQGQ